MKGGDGLARDKRAPRRFNTAIKLTIITAVFLILLLAPTAPGLTPEGQHVLAVVATSILLWITEALPMAVAVPYWSMLGERLAP